MARRGRPSKLTAELQKTICNDLEQGSHRRFAAAKASIDEATLSRWYHRGQSDPDQKDEGGIYRRFFLAVNLAEATFAETAVKTIRNGDPKSAQWLLSRRFPDLYGRKDNVETHSFEDKAASTKALTEMLFERLGRLLPEEPKPQEAPPATPEPAPVAT